MPVNVEDRLDHIPYSPTAYELEIPSNFPSMSIPADNPMTEEGIALGRHLFYDPILSADSTMSCFSCHFPKRSFTDNLAVSTGVENNPGRRSSMSLLNVGFFENGFFWDGRAHTLEEQALMPVEDPVELFESWDNVEKKLRRHANYPKMFREAFGIDNKQQITRFLAAKAIAQFERTLISGNSKFDRQQRGEAFFTDDELEGFKLFFAESTSTPRDLQCGHCHNAPLMNSKDFINNGITAADDLTDFPDLGRGEVTKDEFDNGKFKSVSLKNILLTAPYMHDGRFETIDEVLEHYRSGGKPSPNVDNFIIQLRNQPPFTEEEKQYLIAFLNTLTDTSYYSNPAFFSPFD